MSLDTLLEVFMEAYGQDVKHLPKIVQILKNAGVESRHLCEQPKDLVQMRDFSQRNRKYQEAMRTYVVHSAKAALDNAQIQPRDVDLIVTTSCTGHMIPSADVHLIHELGFRPDVIRIPVTQIGCAGGLYGIARARDFCLANPGKHALVVAAEFGSYAFVPEDLSMSAMVGIALFGDGASATVVGPQSHLPGLKLGPQKNLIVPNSERYLAFDLERDGFHVIIDRAIARAMGDVVGPAIQEFLDDNNVIPSSLDFWGVHPGGKKIIGGIRDAFSLSDEDLKASWQVLRTVGNLSSASILVVLRELLLNTNHPKGAQGFLAAFGPGFNIEMMLAEWA